ncbi:hypothetical protein Ciccas_008164 [Cichlidogyrus casuarinus]|uniref:Uncharacterized protein n=1 Tax=Cichlidogyrus casuarinus TaxID=1844966 RepID=A0ABD2Q4X2_9PLAT
MKQENYRPKSSDFYEDDYIPINSKKVYTHTFPITHIPNSPKQDSPENFPIPSQSGGSDTSIKKSNPSFSQSSYVTPYRLPYPDHLYCRNHSARDVENNKRDARLPSFNDNGIIPERALVFMYSQLAECE